MGDARLDVRTVAAGRWRSILLSLGMDERTLNGRHCACPICGGRDRFRFDDKDGRGTYFCSGCGAGDGVKLVMGLTGQAFKDAARQIERLAGVVQPTASKPERTDEDKLAALRRVWSESRPIQRGDEAARYLAERGLKLYELPESIRVHQALRYHDGETVGTYAAMLATVTGPDGKARSLHRTYLQAARKAPVVAPKKLMQGLPLSGAAIRLTAVSQVLGIAEGIETALAASELFEVPVWSCISTAGIESFEPPTGVREVVVFADNDVNFAGQKAAFAAAHRLKLRGFEVSVRIPPSPGDWLDELNRRASKPRNV
ncbi:MAG: toprim domain-containing protein [Opitutaceae bacterium]|nr:toprim domain-containing protein [Opitutaceae bacterium]